ncbi:MAG: hypothetical protein H6Q63_724, partial [Firmicutes bacterium]|nr:hypothetical protein [Bacillota bacterium]
HNLYWYQVALLRSIESWWRLEKQNGRRKSTCHLKRKICNNGTLAATKRSRNLWGRSKSSRHRSLMRVSGPCPGCRLWWTGPTFRSVSLTDRSAQSIYFFWSCHSGLGLFPGNLCRVRQPLHLGEHLGRAHPRLSLPGRRIRIASLRQHEACGHPALDRPGRLQSGAFALAPVAQNRAFSN